MNPDEIIRPPEEQTVWIYGSGHPKEGQVAAPNTKGAFPVIRTTVVRRDGRVEVWQRNPDQDQNHGVLMPNPVSYIDTDVATKFQEAKDKAEADAAKPQPAPTTRTINGVPHVYQGKDENGQDIWAPAQTTGGPAQPASTTTGTLPTVTGTEGTQNPDGTWDNSKPRKVVRVASGPRAGEIVSSVPLTGDDYERWENEQKGLGPKTNAEIKQSQQAQQAQNDPVGKPTGNTKTVDENGQRVTKTEFVLPDGKTVWRTQEAPAPTSSARQPQLAPDKKSWGYWEGDKWVTIPADKAPPLPGEPPKPPTNVEGTYGTWEQKDGQWTFVPVQNQPGQKGLPKDAPQIDTSSPQAAFDSYQRLIAWTNAKVASGEIRPEDVKPMLETPHAQVSMILQREKDQQGTLLTQRGQDTNLQTNALSNATTGLSTGMNAALTAARYVGGGPHAGNILMGTLALQRAQAQNVGWNPNGVPQVLPYPAQVPGGVVPGPVVNSIRPYAPGTVPVPTNTGAGEPGVPGAPSPVPAAAVPGSPTMSAAPQFDPAAAAAAEAAARASSAAVPPMPPQLSDSGAPLLPGGSPVNAGSQLYVNEATGATQLIHPSNLPYMEGNWRPISDPIQMATPVVPTMALSKAMGTGGYDPAIASLKAAGFDDSVIKMAMDQHLMGV